MLNLQEIVLLRTFLYPSHWTKVNNVSEAFSKAHSAIRVTQGKALSYRLNRRSTQNGHVSYFLLGEENDGQALSSLRAWHGEGTRQMEDIQKASAKQRQGLGTQWGSSKMQGAEIPKSGEAAQGCRKQSGRLSCFSEPPCGWKPAKCGQRTLGRVTAPLSVPTWTGSDVPGPTVVQPAGRGDGVASKKDITLNSLSLASPLSLHLHNYNIELASLKKNPPFDTPWAR